MSTNMQIQNANGRNGMRSDGKSIKQQSEQSYHDDKSNQSQTLPQIANKSGQKMYSSPSQGITGVGQAYRSSSNGHFATTTARSQSVVPIASHQDQGISRKAIREGIDMLEAKYLQKDGTVKAQALESRIKRLVFEENRAKKLTEIANEKAEKLLKARDRHQRQLEERLQREQIKIEKIEKVKQYNRIQKERHMEKVSSNRFAMQQRIMGMKRVMVNQEKDLFERRIRDEEIEYWRKRKQRDEIDQNKRQFIHMKIESQKIIEEQQRQNYQLLQQERHMKIDNIHKQINQLEDVEKLLVEKLGMTQMNQHQALSNLHKVVQICNSGINLKQQAANAHMPAKQYNTIATIPNKKPMNLRLNQESERDLKKNEDNNSQKMIEQAQQIAQTTPGIADQQRPEEQEPDSNMMITAIEGDNTYQTMQQS